MRSVAYVVGAVFWLSQAQGQLCDAQARPSASANHFCTCQAHHAGTRSDLSHKLSPPCSNLLLLPLCPSYRQAIRLQRYGVGHSLGALLHALIGSRYPIASAGNVLMSYNNRPATGEPPCSAELEHEICTTSGRPTFHSWGLLTSVSSMADSGLACCCQVHGC